MSCLTSYAELLEYVSVPYDKINDYEWVYDNINRLNPYENRSKYVTQIKLVLGDVLGKDSTIDDPDDKEEEHDGIFDLINAIKAVKV